MTECSVRYLWTMGFPKHSLHLFVQKTSLCFFVAFMKSLLYLRDECRRLHNLSECCRLADDLFQRNHYLGHTGWQILQVISKTSEISLVPHDLNRKAQVLERLWDVEMDFWRWTRVFFGTPTKRWPTWMAIS